MPGGTGPLGPAGPAGMTVSKRSVPFLYFTKLFIILNSCGETCLRYFTGTYYSWLILC